jgi:hypothetical protein
MKIYYYRATKRIDKTALLEFLKKEARKNKDITIKMCEVSGIVYFWASKTGLLEKVDELYPGVFKVSEPPPLEGIVLFANTHH